MSDSATGLLQALQNGEKIAPHVDDLVKKQADLLAKEDNEIKKTFREIEKSLKTLQNLKEDSPVLLRHQEVLSEYSKRVRELNQSIEAIKEASEKKVRPEDLKKEVEELLERTDRYRPKEEYRLHSTGQLPWKTKEPKEVLLLGAVSDAPQGGAPPITQTSPSADDLSSTIDVQITPEIQALAASLNNHPLAIFRHVYNEYRYTPYYGSMKGSLDTYWEKEGNDYDLASLLIALLRASGIPARYVKAKVQVPIDRIQKWVGLDDPMAALIYLATADIPLVGYRQGGQIRYAELEHVYVEAYVPYSNYRGTGEDDRGKLWVPMDPSLKEYRIVQDGVDLFVEMGVDWKAISDKYIGELRNITPIEYYRERIEKQIAQTHSGQSLDSLKRITTLQTRQFDFLPNTLPYTVVEVLDRVAQIPPELRHTVRLQIPSVLDQTLSLPEISGRRITLTFSGATADDQAVIDQYGGIFKVPPYLVRVIPVLRINGNKVAEGASMETAISYSFTIDYTPPGGEMERFDHHILAGSFNAIGITTGKVRPEFLTIAQVEESEESYLPKMLHSLVMKYHHQINQSRELLKDTMRMQGRTFIIESLVSTFQQRQMILGGIPIRFEFTGFTIDAKEMLSASIPIDGKDLEKKGIDFAMIHGHEASYQENRVFEESMFWMGGTSAIKGLQFLKAEGIPIVELSPHQIYANPNLPEVVLDDINNALNMGWNATVPEEIGDLPAVPYIKYDAKTGSAGYMIATLAGGLAQEITPIGHETDLTFMRDLFQASQIRLTPEFVFPESPYSLPLGESVLVGFQVAADGPGETHQVSSRTLLFDTERTHYQPGRWPIYAVLPGEYKFKFDGRDLFVLDVWGPIIHSDSDRYLGISTENGVDIIRRPAKISYTISGPPTINLQTVTLKILNGAGGEMRTLNLPLVLGEGQIAEWDGRDSGGGIISPGGYNVVIEAEADGKKVKRNFTLTAFKLRITTPVLTAMDISPAPVMPQVPFHVEIEPSNMNVPQITYSWQLELAFKDGDRDDKHRIPEVGTSDIQGVRDWIPSWGSLFAGGDLRATVKVTLGGAEAVATQAGYRIRGTNPTQNQIFEFANDIEEQAVAWQESSHRQFNALRNTGIGLPLFGPPHGWGIMQRDPPPSERLIWHWRENVIDGVAYLNRVHADAQSYLNFWYLQSARSPFPDDDWTWDPRTENPEWVWDDGFSRYNTGDPIFSPNGNNGIRNCSGSNIPNPKGCTYADSVRSHIQNQPWR